MKTSSLRTVLVFGGIVALSGLSYTAGSLHESTKKDLTTAMQGEDCGRDAHY